MHPIAPPLPRETYRRPHRGGLILAFGIIGFCFMGIVFGPIAWIMGGNDLRAMERGEMDPEGHGLTQAGRICGIIVTILNLAAVIVGVMLVALLLVGTAVTA